MAEELVSGPLSPERNESIFRDDILPDYLPEAVRLAGRSQLIPLAGQRALARRRFLLRVI